MRNVILTIVAMAAMAASAQTGVLPRSNAASEGVSADAIAAWADSLMALEQTEIHHLMVLRHGRVIAEAHPSPFRADDVHTLFSCSKTVTALAIGCLVDENRLRVTDRVAALLPASMPDSISPDLARMTVRELLTMSAGIKPSLDFMLQGDDWLRPYFSKPVTNLGRFHYDSMCTFALSAIVQEITGETLLQYVDRKLFGPMEITVADWEQTPLGFNTGGYGLRLQAESMAKIGLLILRRGNWQGKQLVSEEWIDEMTRKQIDRDDLGNRALDTNRGYCYQMWRCLLDGAVRADGAYGQFIIISPERDLVVVINGMSERTHAELRLTWQQLIPGVMPDGEAVKSRLTDKQLASRLAALKLPAAKGKSTSRVDRVLTGDGLEFALDSNIRSYRSMRLVKVDNRNLRLMITDSHGTTASYDLSYGRWSEPRRADVVPPYHNGAMPLLLQRIAGLPGRGGEFTVSGNYAWTADGTLHLSLLWNNYITRQDFTVTFDRDNPAARPAVTLSELPR